MPTGDVQRRRCFGTSPLFSILLIINILLHIKARSIPTTTIHAEKIIQFFLKTLVYSELMRTFAKHLRNESTGEMAEWSIAAVLKTVELRGSGGSNPSLSARVF